MEMPGLGRNQTQEPLEVALLFQSKDDYDNHRYASVTTTTTKESCMAELKIHRLPRGRAWWSNVWNWIGNNNNRHTNNNHNRKSHRIMMTRIMTNSLEKFKFVERFHQVN
jgi:hypothetical protein